MIDHSAGVVFSLFLIIVLIVAFVDAHFGGAFFSDVAFSALHEAKRDTTRFIYREAKYGDPFIARFSIFVRFA